MFEVCNGFPLASHAKEGAWLPGRAAVGTAADCRAGSGCSWPNRGGPGCRTWGRSPGSHFWSRIAFTVWICMGFGIFWVLVSFLFTPNYPTGTCLIQFGWFPKIDEIVSIENATPTSSSWLLACEPRPGLTGASHVRVALCWSPRLCRGCFAHTAASRVCSTSPSAGATLRFTPKALYKAEHFHFLSTEILGCFSCFSCFMWWSFHDPNLMIIFGMAFNFKPPRARARAARPMRCCRVADVARLDLRSGWKMSLDSPGKFATSNFGDTPHTVIKQSNMNVIIIYIYVYVYK